MENNKPIIFGALIFAVLLTAYTIIKVMSPARDRLKSDSTRMVNINELDSSEKTKTGAGKTSMWSGSSTPASPRLLTYQQAENYFESYYQEYEQQQQILQESEQKRREFVAGMNGRAGNYFKQGLEAAGRQDYDKAIDSFLLAIKEEPNNMTIRLLAFKKLAALYKQKNDERKYYVSTFKYLEVLEKVEKNPAEVEGIRQLKSEIKGKLATLGE